MELLENYKYYNKEFYEDALILNNDTYKIYEWIFDNDRDLEWKSFNNNQEVIDSFNSCNYLVRRKLNMKENNNG